jgi:hypothetical protein
MPSVARSHLSANQWKAKMSVPASSVGSREGVPYLSPSDDDLEVAYQTNQQTLAQSRFTCYKQFTESISVWLAG